MVLLAVTGCRDLTLSDPPPPPGPGLIAGRLVWQRPGRLLAEPAAGAHVFLLGSNRSAVADTDGRFLLEGITSSEGNLLARHDADADGTIDRQRTFRLADIGAGAGRDIALGDVMLGRSAVVTGKLTRADVGTLTGHAGTPVFVPGAPFVTTTTDDGSFVFEALPEGPVRIGAIRESYAPFESGELVLRAGEAVSLVEGSLVPSTDATLGEVQGRVTLPTGDGLAGVTVTLVGPGSPAAVSTDASGGFRLQRLRAGRFDARFELGGFQPAALYNLVVFGSDVVTVPDVVLTTGSGQPSLLAEVGASLDGGMAVGSDGGVLGSDGGVLGSDGGVLGSDGGVLGSDGGVLGSDGGVLGSDGGVLGSDGGISYCVGADGGAPVAVLEAPPLVDYGESVTFSAGRSADPDCLPLRYRWSALDGGIPPFADNDSYTATRQTFTAATTPTDYLVRVEVVDDQGLTGQANALVRVTPRPRVDAGVDFPVAVVNSTVTLDASGSTEELGRAPLTFAWRVISGPGALQASNAAIVPLKLNGVGLITVEVTVCYLPQHCSARQLTVQGVAQRTVTATILPNTEPVPLVFGGSTTLTAQVSSTDPLATFTYGWQLISGGGLTWPAPMGPQGNSLTVTAAMTGDNVVQLQVTATSTAGTVMSTTTRTVHVIPPPAPFTIIDAGVSALAMWMTPSQTLDPSDVTPTTTHLTYPDGGAGPPFVAKYDDATNRVVAVFERPQVDQQLQLTLDGTRADGGTLGLPVTLSRTTPQLRFVEVAQSQTITSTTDFAAGVSYNKTGPVVAGRYKGGTCATTPCLSAFGLRSLEPQAETSVTASANASTMRRAFSVGGNSYYWVSDAQVAGRSGSTTGAWLGWGTPPGPVLSDGFGLWAFAWSASNVAVTSYTGSVWGSDGSFTTTGAPANPPNIHGAAFGTTRYALAIDTFQKATVYVATIGTMFTSLGSSLSGVSRGRIAVTSTGPVLALLSTSNALTLYRFDGTNWVASPSPLTASSFDLVARGGTAFLAAGNGNTLSVSAVDPLTLALTQINSMTSGNHASGPGLQVGEVELAVGPWGELAMGWSEKDSVSAWRLWLSELR